MTDIYHRLAQQEQTIRQNKNKSSSSTTRPTGGMGPNGSSDGLESGLKLLSLAIKKQAEDPNIYAYKPHEKQEMFHRNEEHLRLYIGGNRAGKTHGGCAEAIWRALGVHPYQLVKSAPTKGRVVGVDFKSLEQIIFPKFKSLIPSRYLIDGNWDASYHTDRRILTLTNGSEIEFCSQEQKLDSFAGVSRDWTWYDEEVPKDVFQECEMRLIDTDGYSWMTLTPVKGLTWLYSDIYTKILEGLRTDVGLVQVSSRENPHLKHEAMDRIFSGLDEDDRAVRESGEFIGQTGLVYKDFSHKVHVIPPLSMENLNRRAKIYTTQDHGYNAPTAVLWVAVYPNGTAIVFNERYVSECIIKDHAEAMLEFERNNKLTIEQRIGDPAMAQRQGVTGFSVLAEYATHGINISKGNNDVLFGVNKLISYFQTPSILTDVNDPNSPRVPIPGAKPGLHITENCVNLIAELKKLRWASYVNKQVANRNNKREEIVKKDDHASDALRYWAAQMPDYKFLRSDLVSPDDLALMQRNLSGSNQPKSRPLTYAEVLYQQSANNAFSSSNSSSSDTSTSYLDPLWEF